MNIHGKKLNNNTIGLTKLNCTGTVQAAIHNPCAVCDFLKSEDKKNKWKKRQHSERYHATKNKETVIE